VTWLAWSADPKPGQVTAPNVALLYLARSLLGNKDADRLIFQKSYVLERTKLTRQEITQKP